MKISRRDFLRMSAYAAATAGITKLDLLKLNDAMAATGKPPVIWFEGLGDQGCVVSAANYFDGVSAGIESVLLSNIELQFNSVLMGACGDQAMAVANSVYNTAPTTPGSMPPSYIFVLTGALNDIPAYCALGEDSSGIYRLVSTYNNFHTRARWVILAGACACYGGVNSIGGNIYSNATQTLIPRHNNKGSYASPTNSYTPINWQNTKTICIPGCPVHPDWLVLTIVHLLTNGSRPPIDDWWRPTSVTIGGTTIPLFQNTVHSQCPRLAEHDAGNFADSVGDPSKCLRKVGCRGKDAYGDCPTRGWNSSGKYCNAPGINHLCIGCSQPLFPDVPFNRKITNIV